MEEFQPGDIVVTPQHKGVYYLVVKCFGQSVPEPYTTPELALIMISNHSTKGFHLPGLCQVLNRSTEVTDWVTQAGLNKGGFRKTGVNIAGVLNKIGEMGELV